MQMMLQQQQMESTNMIKQVTQPVAPAQLSSPKIPSPTKHKFEELPVKSKDRSAIPRMYLAQVSAL